jgi:O-antigen/teichoic acid export membrane protein
MNSIDAISSSRARSGLGVRTAWHHLIAHVRTPLHRDGYALALNAAFTAATGLVYWIIAARSYSAHSVGLNSALISSMMFVAGIASLNLPNVLVRFLPHSGRHTHKRVVGSYCVSAVVALCAAATFVVGVTAWAPRLSFLRTDHGLQAWFVFSTIAWCLFAIQDSVLTALGRAVWVPIENAVFSVVKLGLLVALATSMRAYGIFVSWTLAMLASVIGVNLIIFAKLIPRRANDVRARVISMRDRAFVRYFAADYACSVALLSGAGLMPVIVTTARGPTTNAYWALAYAVMLPLYVFAQSIGTSLMLHGSKDSAELPALTRKAALQGMRVLVPVVVLLLLLAPYLLSLFGRTYADHSTTVLRLLALGAVPNFVLALAVSVARVQRRLRRALVAITVEAVVALGLATPLVHATGATGAGIACLTAQCLVAAVLLLTARRWMVAPAPEPALDQSEGVA